MVLSGYPKRTRFEASSFPDELSIFFDARKEGRTAYSNPSDFVFPGESGNAPIDSGRFGDRGTRIVNRMDRMSGQLASICHP